MRGLVLSLLALMFAAACGSPNEAPSPPNGGVRFLDADQYGAIMLDVRNRLYIGVRRDATEAWRQGVKPDGGNPIGCQSRCPQAALPGPAQSAGNTCVSPDGTRTMALGRRPAIAHGDGRQEPVTDLPYASACGFTATGGGIVAEYVHHAGSGPGSRLRVFDPSGKIVRDAQFGGEALVIADPASARVAFLTGGSLQETDSGTGNQERVVPAVEAARYDGAGSLVVWRADGSVGWL